MDIVKRIAQTDEWGLIALMHEAFIDETSQAIELMGKGVTKKQIAPLYSHLREILAQLTLSFDEKHSLSQDILSIYIDTTELLAEGFRRMEPGILQNAINIMFPLYEAFSEKSKKAPSGENVSGLTYGKNDITEGKSYKGLDIKS